METLRTACIGCGGIAKFHLLAYKELERSELVGVMDINSKNAQSASSEYGGQPYTDYREMIEDTKPQAVSIATPPDSHLEIAQFLFERGIHVLCEKPLTNNLKDTEKLVASAKKHNVILMTAFCHRYYGPNLRLRELVQSGALGKILFFDNVFAIDLGDMSGAWRADKKIAGGGVFVDNLVHSIDIFRYIFGDVASSSAEMTTVSSNIEVEDTGVILLKSKSDVIATLRSSWCSKDTVFSIDVLGTKGSAHINYIENKIYYSIGGVKKEEAFPGKDKFRDELTNFVNVCLGAEEPLVTGEDGLEAEKILYNIYK